MAGDTVTLTFDMGQDGCSGIDGWHVDNVTVVLCASRGKRRAARVAAR